MASTQIHARQERPQPVTKVRVNVARLPSALPSRDRPRVDMRFTSEAARSRSLVPPARSPLTASMPSQRTRDAYDSWSRPNGSPLVALNRHCPPRLAPSLAPTMSYATIPSDDVTTTTHASSTCALVLMSGPAGRRTGSEWVRRGRQPLCRRRVPHRHEQARREPRRVRTCGRCGSGCPRWCRGRQAAQSGPAPPGQQGSRSRVR
jgi:hypothetical protein